MKDIEILKLIKTNIKLAGNGKDDPYRRVTQYWSFEGDLVFEVDEYRDNLNSKNVTG